MAIEKELKAHLTRETKIVPPKIHNLIRLAERAKIVLDEERDTFLRTFNVYQLEGRYPDSVQVPMDARTARRKLAEAMEMVEWLKARF